MTISALPTPPSPLDTPAEFNTKAFNLLGALPDFVTEANALSTDVNAKSSTATSAASSASSSATSASNSAAAAASSATSASNYAASAAGSAASASSSAASALSDANRAEAAAATVDLPSAAGNALKLLRQNSGNTALEYFGMVGPVSQSGGAPTGAIVERAVNANGEYVRFADGTQICWHSFTGGSSWTYPASFSDTARVVLTPFSGLPRVVATQNNTATGTDTSQWDLSGSVQTNAVRGISIGRWF